PAVDSFSPLGPTRARRTTARGGRSRHPVPRCAPLCHTRRTISGSTHLPPSSPPAGDARHDSEGTIASGPANNSGARGDQTMAIVSVSVAPLGTGEPSVSRFVAAALKVLEKYPDLEYRLDPMFTTIQGDLPRIFQAIVDMHEAV